MRIVPRNLPHAEAVDFRTTDPTEPPRGTNDGAARPPLKRACFGSHFIAGEVARSRRAARSV